MRLLDRLGIAYELREYEVDPADLAAETVARKIGLPPEQVFKTLVMRGERRGILLAVVPGDTEVDLKALARAAGDRDTAPVALREVEPLTGYVRGGVTALAGKKAYPVLLDETALVHHRIAVSAGVRGLQMVLAPADYVRATGASVRGDRAVEGVIAIVGAARPGSPPPSSRRAGALAARSCSSTAPPGPGRRSWSAAAPAATSRTPPSASGTSTAARRTWCAACCAASPVEPTPSSSSASSASACTRRRTASCSPMRVARAPCCRRCSRSSSGSVCERARASGWCAVEPPPTAAFACRRRGGARGAARRARHRRPVAAEERKRRRGLRLRRARWATRSCRRRRPRAAGAERGVARRARRASRSRSSCAFVCPGDLRCAARARCCGRTSASAGRWCSTSRGTGCARGSTGARPRSKRTCCRVSRFEGCEAELVELATQQPTPEAVARARRAGCRPPWRRRWSPKSACGTRRMGRLRREDRRALVHALVARPLPVVDSRG